MTTERDAAPELAVFAKKFREAREERGLTQMAVSASVGIDKSHISDIERCCANPTLAVLSKLAAAVRTDLCDLFCTVPGHRTDR
jgi:transcriptional regulator with XRE-family HTH domain